MKKGGIAHALSHLFYPFIFPAVLAFVILFVLALTSNSISVRRLGGVRWKKIHRSVYLAEILVIGHLFLQGGVALTWCYSLFIPLLALQQWRIRGTVRKKQMVSS